MEDVKWLFKKYGKLFSILFIILIVASIVARQRMERSDIPEEKWEPPVEIENEAKKRGGIGRTDRKRLQPPYR